MRTRIEGPAGGAAMELIVVSIGALAKNPLWGEKIPVRTSHATTSVIRVGAANILVDPSLPGQILAARLEERTGLKPEAITAVFLTNWRPVHRRGLEIFEKATWYLHEVERAAAADALRAAAQRVEEGATELEDFVRLEEGLLKRVQAVPDELAEGVDLFPLPGNTPGQCGLLVSTATTTVVIAGDAVLTAGHFSAGQVFGESWDLAKAKDSLMEMYEIADLIVPGHDNFFVTPRANVV